MKEKLFKFKVSSVQYGELLREELAAIKNFIGDYEIVKKRDCPLRFDMIIWCRKKDDTDKKVMTNLGSIFKSRDITLPTKVRLDKAMVFPVVMYGCESWTVKKAEC